MAEKVQKIKVGSPLKLHSGLTGNYHAICHYSYNLPLCTINMKMQQLIMLTFLLCSSYVKSQNTNFEKILRGHSATVLCLDIDTSGTYLCSGSYDTDFILWGYKSGDSLKKYSGHSAAIRKIKVAPNNKYIASASVDSNINAHGSSMNCVSLLDLESLKLLKSFSIEPDRYKTLGFIPELDGTRSNEVSKLSFNSSGTKLAVITKR